MNWPGNLSSLSVGRAAEPARADINTGGGVLFGEHTVRALENFGVRGPRLTDHPELVRAIALVKIAAARANHQLGGLDRHAADAIVTAGREVIAGAHDQQFPLPLVQGGGGTSTNMNVNEVLANRATQILRGQGIERDVHPNDHVNQGQSTNDVMPTAIALAVQMRSADTLDSLHHLVATLRAKAEQYPELEHLGRTCLQDAVALPVRSLHLSHAYGIEQATVALRRAGVALLDVPLGSTAVGTGLGTAPGFTEVVLAELAELSGLPVVRAENPYFVLASLEPLVAVSEAVDRCGRAAARIATDLRLLASGPIGGIGEIDLPQMQAGSSIMPGKVNPVIPELAMQMSFQISGEATSARLAAGAGELEVSAMAPVVTLGVLAGLERLAAGARILADRCLAGMTWNETSVKANLAGSLSQAVLNAKRDGYDTVAQHIYSKFGPEPGTATRATP